MINALLPVEKTHIEQYNHKIYTGINLLENSKITAISLVRNIGKKLDRNIEIIANFFLNHSQSYSHIFFENDSIDDTKNILSKYKEKYQKNLHIISQNFNRASFGSVKNIERIKALSEYRNITKKYAKDIDSDFVIVLDMDFDDINLSGLLNSFGWFVEKTHISAIAGNSFQYKPGLYKEDPFRYNLWNYDSWAFRLNWWQDLQKNFPAPQNTIDPMIWFGFWIPPTGSFPIEVNSAFGGCCIYRSGVYFQADYAFSDCEHVCFHYNLYANKNINFSLVLNPSQQMVFKE